MIIFARNTILVSMFLLMQLIPNVSLADNQKLQLDISLSKEIYILREPIWLDVTLTNISADTIRITRLDPPCQGGVGIVLRDSIGREIPYTGPSIMLGPRKGFILDPGEKYYDCFDILELFNTSRGLFGVYFGLLPQGKYEVQARYREANSQKLTLGISDPTATEREVLQLMEDAFDLILNQQPDSATERFKDVAYRFPSSVYAEKASHQFLALREMLRKYPNTGYGGYYLRVLTWKKPKEEKQLILQEVIAKAPQSRTKKFAEQMLKMLEKQVDKDTTEQGMKE